MSGYDNVRKETEEHIKNVGFFIKQICDALNSRGLSHDRSKLFSPEIDAFVALKRKTEDIKYGTPEYDQGLEELKPALANHYAKNRHHPQHFPNGISGMNLIDIVEMVADWKASTMRYKEGNILTSINENVKRFNISPDLASILRNTAELFELVITKEMEKE